MTEDDDDELERRRRASLEQARRMFRDRPENQREPESTPNDIDEEELEAELKKLEAELADENPRFLPRTPIYGQQANTRSASALSGMSPDKSDDDLWDDDLTSGSDDGDTSGAPSREELEEKSQKELVEEYGNIAHFRLTEEDIEDIKTE